MMCGRTACTLEPDGICTAYNHHYCATSQKKAIWRNNDGGGQYFPCYNIGPTKHVPVVISSKHFNQNMSSDDQVIIPISWGLFRYTSKTERIINARAETILEKPTFKLPLLSGKRCVVLADGYYEWFRGDAKNKQPYFIYLPQPNEMQPYEPQLWKPTEEKSEIKSPKLLAIAGVFDNIKENNELGFVVITVPSSTAVVHIHDRMPALLDNEHAVHEWLDFGKIKAEQAVNLLKSSDNVVRHMVSPVVNNIRNNSLECVIPYVKKDPEKKTRAFMEGWLKRTASNSQSTNKDCKREKSE